MKQYVYSIAALGRLSDGTRFLRHEMRTAPATDIMNALGVARADCLKSFPKKHNFGQHSWHVFDHEDGMIWPISIDISTKEG